MSKIHVNDLNACGVCNNCIERNFPWYICACGNDNFGDISFPDDCDEFEYKDDDYFDDDDDDDDDVADEIECPRCGDDAHWNGSEYECDNCGWCGEYDND